MKTPLHRDVALDGLDAEQFERMLASGSWKIFRDRLLAEWDRVRTRCLTETDLVQLRRSQGAAEALWAVMTTPDTILKDLRARPAKHQRAAE
jgi:hypothetical protein